jgi:hypothetical protein
MMERRLRMEALLGLAVATLGCDTKDPEDTNDGETGDGDAGFELVSASLDAGGQSVTLHFSEPVGSLDGVDPSAFRISVAVLTALCGDGECVDQTSYVDPNFYANYYIGYEPSSNVSFVVDQVSAGNQATEVSLHFATPLEPVLCEYFAPQEDEYDFLYVHYKPGDIPLNSSEGEALAAMGPEWVEYSSPVPSMHVDGNFPSLDPKVSIPCL